jgi:phospholipid transport system transporter-binding protein
MTDSQIRQQDTQHFLVEGELNMVTVPTLLQAMASQFPTTGSQVHIDLAGVTRSDSAGLALLMEWLRLAKTRNMRLQFHNLPLQLREIARVSDLLPLLPLG